MWSILHFEAYLRYQTFTVRTDNEALKWIWKTSKKRVMRWAIALQEFNFRVEYRKGSKQAHVDIFTRDIEWSQFELDLETKLDNRFQIMKITADELQKMWKSPTVC